MEQFRVGIRAKFAAGDTSLDERPHFRLTSRDDALAEGRRQDGPANFRRVVDAPQPLPR